MVHDSCGLLQILRKNENLIRLAFVCYIHVQVSSILHTDPAGSMLARLSTNSTQIRVVANHVDQIT